ncbi:type IV pilin-like G/H family protein [Nostoc sp. ATCC 53789]|uniref:type IV pilin-like G/H family protein n=1 Tax=Nostoc sp. ATCC 53789 TaxID=76335 RepID=UPI000DED1BF1|nr:type IV pilin-like G/H family protein [Nostoc sp. ATCC 53789]QHG15601.1 prepilin-type N-terminal cleavage/methylation domain-containing protein [Nostoc sp. ATCC 53789]RCJ29325.1 pesticin [Nostoc sp. ATCC 53789]
MKTELKAKFLQHIIGKKKENEGFTLIELLVVIIIIGILSAIALPSFLNQANKGKQSEAKQYSGSMNRAQQAYFLENGSFTTELNSLGMGIRSQTENYIYAIGGAATGVSNNGYSLKAPLKSYVGVVALSIQAGTSEATTLAVLCESDAVGARSATVAPAFGGTPVEPSCPSSFSPLKSK